MYYNFGLPLLLLRIALCVNLIEFIQLVHTQHPPCYFNPLCTCSKAAPDLGQVNCHDVPMIRPPTTLNQSAIYILSFRRNSLKEIPEFSLYGTNMWRLEIQENRLTRLYERSLSGLERDLWELDLRWNQLIRIPGASLFRLKRLQVLNLSGNFITDLYGDDFKGIGKTLRKLMLAENSLTHIHQDSLQNLEVLEALDLSRNSILNIHDAAFQNGPGFLNFLNLACNQVTKVPYTALKSLNQIHSLDLSNNRIYTLQSNISQSKISVDELHLEHNLISILNEHSFLNFLIANKTYLTGNPIIEIRENTFSKVSIGSLTLQDCEIRNIDNQAFVGLENSLRNLDMGYNNLSAFPTLPLKPLQSLQSLNLRGNRQMNIHKSSFDEISFRLNRLDLSEVDDEILLPEGTQVTEDMQFLNLGGQKFQSLNENVLEQFGQNLEYVWLVDCSIAIIDEFAFESSPRLKRLDLSNNNIEDIHLNAFHYIGHSLRELKVQNGFSMITFPSDAICKLTNIKYLDFSNNFFYTIPDDAVICLKQLEHINLNHNMINALKPSHFRRQNTPNVKHIRLAFNQVERLDTGTFNGLRKLESLELNDNKITIIERAAFENLNSLVYLNLEGNYITILVSETFQNIRQLRYLQLAYNKLEELNLNSLEQVSRATALTLDAQHNNINKLIRRNDTWDNQVNIKSLNLYHNNISIFEASYFKTLSNSLQTLDLSFNNISFINSSQLSTLKHLQMLDLSNNNILKVEKESFAGLKNLQILNISRNHLKDIPQELFSDNGKLRIVDFSDNGLEFLPDGILEFTEVEEVHAASNELLHFPNSALAPINGTLLNLDLSRNQIRLLNSHDFRFLENIINLDISNNEVKTINGQPFQILKRLVTLDLSNNPIQKIEEYLQSFPSNVEDLNLSGTNLSSFPALAHPNLLQLNLSHNQISFITSERLENVSQLRELDLSSNLLSSTASNVWHSFPRLRRLNLSNNLITGLSNDSFIGLDRLQYLDIQGLALQHFQAGALRPITLLRTLGIDVQTPLLPLFSLSENQSLRNLYLRVEEADFPTKLSSGKLPKSLRVLSIEGANLQRLNQDFLQNLQTKELLLRLHNTNITWIPEGLFGNVGKVQNLSLDFRGNELRMIPDVLGETNQNKVGPPFRLNHILLSGNQWHCDCNLAWVNLWFRKMYNSGGSLGHMDPNSDEALKDMRLTVCLNKTNRTLIDVFKTDFNCLKSHLISSTCKIVPTFTFIHSLLSILMLMQLFNFCIG